MENQVIKKSRIRILLCMIFTYLIIFLTFRYAGGQLKGSYTDYNGHTHVYLNPFLYGNWKQAWTTVPYFLWHVVVLFFHRFVMTDLDTSAAFSSCVFAVMDFFIFEYVLRRAAKNLWGEEKSFITPVLAFGLCFLQGFYPKWLDVGQGALGVFSMNPLHNPPQMCVRGISVLCFCLVVDILEYQKRSGTGRRTGKEPGDGIFFSPGRNGRGYYIALAALLLLSTIAKPTFAEMFIPAVGIYMLLDFIVGVIRKTEKVGDGLKKIGIMFACAVPSILSILLQFSAYFLASGGKRASGGVIFTAPFAVWSLYSDNVALSILLGMAFPLLVLLWNAEAFIKETMGRLALLSYVAGLSEAAFLGEGGENFTHGNFLWPVMSGMLLMWVAAVIHLMGMEHEDYKKGSRKLSVYSSWALFAGHVFVGILMVLGS